MAVVRTVATSEPSSPIDRGSNRIDQDNGQRWGMVSCEFSCISADLDGKTTVIDADDD